MNFESILTKIRALESSSEPMPSDPDNPQTMEASVEECGNMPSAADDQVLTGGQGDVTINMSMSDLLALMAKMEKGHDDVVVGMGEAGADGGFEDATTSPDQETLGVNAVTQTGDDLASKGAEAEKVNGGGNPFNVDESLLARLSGMYNEIKESKKEKEPEGLHSSKRFETDSQRVARLAKEKRQAEKKAAAEKTDEAYNPNSSAAQHRRDMDKHDHDRLKAAAEKDDATDADKARYKRYQDRKAAMRAAYNDRMER